jgi:hypothetical protein
MQRFNRIGEAFFISHNNNYFILNFRMLMFEQTLTNLVRTSVRHVSQIPLSIPV